MKRTIFLALCFLGGCLVAWYFREEDEPVEEPLPHYDPWLERAT